MPESLAQYPALPEMTLPDVMRLLETDLDRFEAALESLERVDIPLSSAIQDHVLSLRGKRARPLLLMLVARLGEKQVDDEVLWSSVALELIHTASLLHDDCLDGATLRRGLPTVNHRWGSQAAILMGDFLFTKGFEILCEHRLVHALRIMSLHTYRMTCGMNREYAAWRNPTITPADYLRIVDEKTAALFCAACEIGGVLASLEDGLIAQLSAFGRDLGHAFQIIDDIFDFSGDPLEIGKPVGTDFRLGFATLPLIHALENGNGRRATRVASIFKKKKVSDEEWEEARSFVLESGGVEAARERALSFALSARARLAVLNGSEGAAPLHATVEYMIARGR
jgi:octaprenyl-diphosphate synthase